MTAALEIQDLSVSYRTPEGEPRPALAGVNLDLKPGEILGVLGESGSGKSTLAAAILRLLPPNGHITNGTVLLDGKSVSQSTSEELRQIRGGRLAPIFQEPSLALHPTMRAGEQVRQVLAAHGFPKSALKEKIRQLFAQIFAQDAERISRSYPHQLSGGQRQRVLIAQAIACNPAVIIADEPTASLDPTTQLEILDLFRDIRERLGLAMIFITHNPALLSGFADRVLILYGGRAVELGPTAAVLASPRHPYTKALIQSIPASFDERIANRKTRMVAIAGDSWRSTSSQRGCCFEPRCPEAMDICREREPALVNLGTNHAVSCFKYEN